MATRDFEVQQLLKADRKGLISDDLHLREPCLGGPTRTQRSRTLTGTVLKNRVWPMKEPHARRGKEPLTK
jgi:hypothetical protein